MFYNLKIAIRNLRMNGIYSVINIIGLAISLSVCILIMLWVWDELSFEKCYKNSKDIYSVSASVVTDGQENIWNTPTAVSHVAKDEIPGVKYACSVNSNYDLGYLEYDGTKFFGDQFFCVGTSFFQIFETTFLEGSIQNAFPEPNSVVLTQSVSKKIFGNESPLGKQIFGGNGNGRELESYNVSAVVADPPKNTRMQYGAVFSFEYSRFKNTWMNWSWGNYVLLDHQVDRQLVAEKLHEIQKKNFSGINTSSFNLQPIEKVRLYSADGKPTGISSIRLFALIALILLTTACINYVNLSTARVNKRNKEVSIKKILGARRFSLFNQLLNETAILFAASLVCAMGIVWLLIPYYNQLSGKEFILQWNSPIIWSIFGLSFLFIMVVAGIYPALKLSSFAPLTSLTSHTGGGKIKFDLRKLLVVLQFIAVSGLIFSTLVMNRQLHYIQNKQVGYDKEQMLSINFFTNLDMRKNYENFKAELEKETSIMGVTGSDGNILYAGGTEPFNWEGKEDESKLMLMINWGVDDNLFSVLNMNLLEGSGFTDSPADSRRCYLNETAVRKMGIKDPVGKWIHSPAWMQKTAIPGVTDPNGNWTNTPELEDKVIIAGVIKDFNFEPLQNEIEPLVVYSSGMISSMYIKIAPGKVKEAIAATERTWKKYNQVFPFTYTFLDDEFNNRYRSDQQKETLFGYFSIVAILISCLGLFGLVTYTAEIKTKEIGIRKVLGASVINIVNMLSKEFLILVGIAMLIAFPLAYYWLDKMLQDYAYRISIGWWMFGLAALITLVLTLVTVGFQAVKAATANPVKSIKTE